MIGAGELRQRVTIQSIPRTDDGHRGWTKGVPVVVHRRIAAKVMPLQGRDLDRARQIDPRLSHEVTVRYWRNYVADLAGGRNQVIYHDVADRTFEIVGPPVDAREAHEQLTFQCKEAA